jgi:large repetitive protein
MSIIDFNKFFINKKYHMKKLFTLLIALCSFLSWSFGQVYSNDFSGGSVSMNKYVGTPSSTPGPLLDYVFENEWTASTGTTLALSGGALRFSPLSSATATINLKIKVRCGYQLNITGVTFKHSRNTDGPQEVDLKIGSTTIGTINPVPTGSPVAASFSPSGLPQTTLGEINVFLDLKGINAPATGEYFIDDFEIQGTYSYVGPIITNVFLARCENTSATFTPTIPSVSPTLTNPTYQWYYGVTNVGMSSISGETGASYMDGTVLEADQGVYGIRVNYTECVGDHTNTAVSGNSGLNVNSINPGSITPATVVRCQGDLPSPTLTIGSQTGDGTLSYAWRRSNTFMTAQVSPAVNGVDPETMAANPVNPGIVFRYFKALVSSEILAGGGFPLSVCTEETNVASVQTNARPLPTITGVTPVCAGSMITPTYTPGVVLPATFVSATWSTSNGNTTINTLTGVITGVSSGTSVITYSVTDNNGCTSSTTATITINPLPTPSVSGSSAVCAAGATITLTGIPGVVSPVTLVSEVWSTSDGTKATVNTATGVVTGVAAGTAIISYTVTDNNGCIATATQSITVNALPVPSISGNGSPSPFEVCSSSNITLTGTPVMGGVWSITGGTYTSSATVANAITFTGLTVAPTAISYTVTSGAGCTATATAAITVNAIPANPTITPNTPSICEGTSVNLIGSAGSGGTAPYFTSWTANGPANVTFGQTGPSTATVTAGSATAPPNNLTYSVNYSISDNKGCTNATAATATITVDAKPSIASIPVGNQQQCDIPSFTVSATAPLVGTGVWSVTGGTATPTNSNVTIVSGVTAGTTAIATWTVSNGSCAATSSNIASVNLQNNILPTVTGTNPAPLCNTSSFNISATVTPNIGTGVWTSPTAAITFGSTSNATTTANNVPFGTHNLTYTVTVGTGLGACTASTTIQVTNNQPPATVSIATPPQQSCSAAGIFSVTANNPAPGTGVWSSSHGTVAQTGFSALISGVPQGVVATATWTVTTTGCGTGTATVTLTNYANPTANAGVNQDACNQFGAFTVTGTKSPAAATTVWSVTGGTITGSTTTLSASVNVVAGNTATATFTVTNGTCPAVTSSMTITNYAQPTITALTSPITVCNQTTDFSLSGTPSVGTGSWSVTGGTGSISTSNSTSATVTVAPGNTATITYTVVNGTCSTNSSVLITNYAQPTITSITSNINACNQLSNFSLSGTPSVGTGAWTVTAGTGSITTSSTTTASVSVTPGNSATFRYTVTNGTCSTSSDVVVTNYQAPTADITQSNIVVCGQITNFNLTATKTPNIASAIGVWSITGGSIISSSETSAEIAVTAGNTATVTYTVTNGGISACSSAESITITNNPALTATIMPDAGQPSQMCPGTSIVLKAVPSGGSGTYSSQSFVGGTGSGSNFTVNFNSNPITNPNRLATINGINPQDPVVLTYTIFDANGVCSATQTYTTKVNNPIVVAISPTPVCVGSMATITPSVSGGSGIYSTYSWTVTGGNATGTSTGTSFFATGVTQGSANVMYTVTDNQTCSASATTTSNPITVNPLPVITFTSQVNVLCKGAATGSVTANGGTSYAWNTIPAQNTATATGLTAGTYTVTVTTASSCSATSMVTITEPAILLSVSISPPTNILCFGNATGSATAVGVGGNNTSYTYSWSGTDYLSATYTGSGATISGLKAGVYTVTVTDANSCTATTASVTITQPAVGLSVSASVTTQIACFGGSGSATAAGAGGTVGMGYTYVWSNMQTTATATGLTVAGGLYTVTVTDANMCTSTASISITQPTELSVTASITTPISCFGGSGSATAVGAGGTVGTGYTYLWSNTQTTATATGLTVAGGSYTVTVTDANMCTSTASISITQPTAVAASANATVAPAPNPNLLNVKCYGDATGQATVNATGGTGIYTYAWSGSDYLGAPFTGTGSPITGLKAGTYTVTVSDANACSGTLAISTIVLTQPGAALAIGATPASPLCASGQAVLPANELGSIASFASNGVEGSGYMYQLSNAANTSILVAYQSSGNFTGLAVGTYTITTKDANGCEIFTTATILPQTPALLPPTITKVDASGITNNDAVVCTGASVTLTAALSGAFYAWSGGISNGSSFVPAMTTTYTVTATVGACYATAQQVVTVNPLPSLTGVTSPDPTCQNAGAFGILFTANNNGADSIEIQTWNPAGFVSAVPGFTLTKQRFSTNPFGISIPSPLVADTYGFLYRVINSSTGCVSNSNMLPTSPTTTANTGGWATINVLVNAPPTATFIQIPGDNYLCDGSVKNLQITSTSPTTNRNILLQRDSAGVLTTRTIVATGAVNVSTNFTYRIDTISGGGVGTWSILGVSDANLCAGTVSSGTTTLSDARFKIVGSSNDTVTVYPGCIPTLTTSAMFVSPLSVGTLTYQWQVNSVPPTGYVDTLGQTSTTLTLANPIAASNDGYRYRAVITNSGLTGTGCPILTNVKEDTITIKLGVIAALAGSDQTVFVDSVTMAATLPPNGFTGTWSIVTAPARFTLSNIANVNSPTTKVYRLPGNDPVTLRWTVSSAQGCGASDDVTLTHTAMFLNTSAMLEGPFVSPAVGMRDTLNHHGSTMAIPTGTNLIPLSSGAVNVYPGTTQSVPVGTFFQDVEAVDWVLIELYASTGSLGINGELTGVQTLVGKRAALLQKDGTIVDIDGISPVPVNLITGVVSGQSYYVIIKHRNHVAFRSLNPLTFTNGVVTTADFANVGGVGGAIYTNATFGYTPVKIVGTKRLMYCGDANGSGATTTGDINAWNSAFSTFIIAYKREDVTMDGRVTPADKNNCIVPYSGINAKFPQR